MARIPKTPRLKKIKAVVMDFDGVHTDNTVYVDEHGNETVRCSRSDGMGVTAMKDAGLELLILSKEKNAVVARRGEKLDVEVIQGCDNKLEVLKSWLGTRSITAEHCVYIGNDINDLECLEFAGISVAPADAHNSVIHSVSWILSNKGGRGAIREMSDVLIDAISKGSK